MESTSSRSRDPNVVHAATAAIRTRSTRSRRSRRAVRHRTGQPKLADEPIESLRALRAARSGAVKATTAATNALNAMVITAPVPLRSQLTGLTTTQLVNTCTKMRPDLSQLDDPTQAPRSRCDHSPPGPAT
jgi:hypothetical protein